jgi:mono/diheme cytochrome c family protein
MRTIKQIIPSFGAALLFALAAACASAPTPAPTAIPPSPTPIQPPTAALPTSGPTSAPTTAPTTAAASEPTSASSTGAGSEITGASLFQMSCSPCHGLDAAGKTFEMDNNTIKTPSLSWADLSQMYSSDPSRGSVEQQFAIAVTKGLDESGDELNSMMPRWSSLSQSQMDSLAQYLQAGVPAAGATPALSDAAANLMGEQLFQTSCAACHGQDAAGKTFEMDGNSISTPSLSWSDLSQAYASDPSRGSVEQQLALAITKGLDESGDDLNPMMPRWSFLSQAQVDSLIQYLQTKGTPASATPASTGAATDLMGQQLFQVTCAECHGLDAAGKTFEDNGNTISTPSLSWADLSQMYSSDPSRGTVEQQFVIAVTKGLDESGDELNSMMPRWSSLSQAQVDSLAQYLQTGVPTTSATPTLTGAAANLMGEQLFQTSCAACHGQDGAGKTFEMDSNTISTPSLSWADLSQTYASDPSRGSVEQQLVLAITKGLDESGDDLNPMMPRWSFLSQAQVDSVIQYIQATFK